MIVAGLYAVLWGKDKEMKQKIGEAEAIKPGEKNDLELQMPANANGNNHVAG